MRKQSAELSSPTRLSNAIIENEAAGSKSSDLKSLALGDRTQLATLM